MRKQLSSRSIGQPAVRLKRGFSLIEVLFAVAFLIMVGLAMAALNTAAARLITSTEIRVEAQSLNEQTLAYVALQRKTLGSQFDTTYVGCISTDGSKTCYVTCPPTQVDGACTLSSTRKTITLGNNKLQYEPSVVIKSTSGKYTLIATTSWGGGINRQIVASELIQ